MKIPNKIIPFLVSVLGLFVGYFFANPLVFNFCERSYVTANYISCLDKTIELIGYPFFNFFILVLPVTLIALFIREKVFGSWARFALWWIPLSLLCAYFAPVTSGQTMVIFPITHDGTAKFFGELFVWISLCFFIFKSSFFQIKIHPLFRSWFKFAAWYVPVSITLLPWTAYFFEYGISTVTIMNHTFFSKGTTGIYFLFILFAIISLLIFAFKSWQLRKQEK